MSNLYSKILVACDFSDLSKKAVRTAVKLAEQNPGASLEIITVLQPLYAVSYEVIAYNDYYKDLKENAEEKMDRLRRELGDTNVPITTRILDGIPGLTIAEHAVEKGSDLIVMGSRGLGGIKELLLGSVSHYVAQKAACPVLIVK